MLKETPAYFLVSIYKDVQFKLINFVFIIKGTNERQINTFDLMWTMSGSRQKNLDISTLF